MLFMVNHPHFPLIPIIQSILFSSLMKTFINRFARRALLCIAEKAVALCHRLEDPAHDSSDLSTLTLDDSPITAEVEQKAPDATIQNLSLWMRGQGVQKCQFVIPGVHIRLQFVTPAAQSLIHDLRGGLDTPYPIPEIIQPYIAAKTHTHTACNANQTIQQKPTSH